MYNMVMVNFSHGMSYKDGPDYLALWLALTGLAIFIVGILVGYLAAGGTRPSKPSSKKK